MGWPKRALLKVKELYERALPMSPANTCDAAEALVPQISPANHKKDLLLSPANTIAIQPGPCCPKRALFKEEEPSF